LNVGIIVLLWLPPAQERSAPLADDPLRSRQLTLRGTKTMSYSPEKPGPAAHSFSASKGECADPWQRVTTDNAAVTVTDEDTEPVPALPATSFGDARAALRSHITGGAPDRLIAGTRVTVENFQHPEFITLFTGANAQRASDDVERYRKWHTAAGTLAHHW